MGGATRICIALLLAFCSAVAAAQALPRPGPRDLCPVCGMLVSKYPHWLATAAWNDGRAHHFDGAKDLFKYLHDLPAYAPGRKREEIAQIAVTDFYNLAPIDARQAWYVIGSDVLGPMGHELVPLATRPDAEEFLKDHKGRGILRFEEVNAKVLAQLDAGRFQ